MKYFIAVGLIFFLFGCQSSSNHSPGNSYGSKDFIETNMVLKCQNPEKQIANEFSYYKIEQRVTGSRIDILGLYEREYADWKPWCKHTLRAGAKSYICDSPLQDNGFKQKKIIDLTAPLKVSWLVFENNKLVLDLHGGCGVDTYNIN